MTDQSVKIYCYLSEPLQQKNVSFVNFVNVQPL